MSVYLWHRIRIALLVYFISNSLGHGVDVFSPARDVIVFFLFPGT